MTTGDAILPTCDCCQPATHQTPIPIENRPGRAALIYRVGTHRSFNGTMLARLATQPELASLTTRERDDPSIALIEAWASVLDVLTFYQERIANEGYLRTATEPRSVHALAAQIGYEPRPGVAAAGYLAFELETGPGSPASVDIPLGAKVQSIPGPEEKPQTFETMESIDARPRWNRIRVRASERHVPGMSDREAWFEGTSTNLRPGDAILFVGAERLADRGSEHWDFRLLSTVEPDQDRQVTRVTWDRGLGWNGAGRTVMPAAKDVRCYALRQRAALFGAAAPDFASMPDSVRGEKPPKDWRGLRVADISGSEPDPSHTIFLDAIYPRLVADSWIVLQQPSYQELFRPDPSLGVDAIADDARTGFTLSAKTTRVVLQGENLLEKFNSHVRDTVVFLVSEELPMAETPLAEPVMGRTIEVDDPLEGLRPGRSVLIVGPRARLQVPDRAHPTLQTEERPVGLKPRDALVVVGPPVTAGATTTWSLENPAGIRGTIAVTGGKPPFETIRALPTDEVIAEAAVVKQVSPIEGEPSRAVLELVDALGSVFDRSATTVAANVAPATHGERRSEILGSGDGSVPFPSFALKDSPVTHIPATTPEGAVTTLTVKVNTVVWQGAPGLDGLGQRERAYVAQTADDGTTTVHFGDGRTGARLPTGVENVTATYRVGIGAAGNLKAGQLSQLMTRPLGTRAVTNPLPTTGGADPESRDEARLNAPRTVLTFDRVVSLVDHADFARSFAGILKAEARWVWQGRTRVVLVSVAGPKGAPVPPQKRKDLADAIRAAGDPHLPFRVESFDGLTFNLEAGVFIADDRDWETMAASVRQSLLDAFSFDRRELAQSVTVSEVTSAIQVVDGVVAVDVDATGIRLTGHQPPTKPVLMAQRGRVSTGGTRPAQLITINPAPGGISISRRT